MNTIRHLYRTSLGVGVAITLFGAGGLPLPLSAAEAADPAIEALKRQVLERDRQLEEQKRITEDLLRRVQMLEQRLPAAEAAPGPVQPPKTQAQATQPPKAVDQPPKTQAQAAQPPKAEDQPPETQAQAQPPSPGSPPAQRPAAPGQLEVDEDAAERALERTLVATGALLLPYRQAEVEPAIIYSYSETGSDLPSLATVDKVQRAEITGILGLRLGLPFDSQVEMAIPYNYAHQKTVLQIGGARDSRSGSGNAWGDIKVGLAKTLLREGPWWPDLIGRVTYDSNTGEKFDNDVALDGGFNRIRGALTALKRQDPFAFVATVSYDNAFEDDNLRPGNRFGLGLAAVLAASPETSLRFGLQQSFINDVEFNGEVINDSDQTQSVLQVGLSSVLGPGVLFDISAGVGLTDDSPDYTLGISIPIRFNVPLP